MNRPQTFSIDRAADLVDVDALVAFHRGDLDGEAEDRVRAQLERSPAALAELIDLNAFPELPVDDGRRFDQAEIGSAWQAFAAELDAEQQPKVVSIAAHRRRFAPKRVAPWLALAAAATFAVIGVQWKSGNAPALLQQQGVQQQAVQPPPAQILFANGFEDGVVDVVQAPAKPSRETIFATSFEDGAGMAMVNGSRG